VADEWPDWAVRFGRWLEQYGLLVIFGIALLMFIASMLLWKPGTRPIAPALFVFALIPPLAFLAVWLDSVEE
jgi:hypothetical protein